MPTEEELEQRVTAMIEEDRACILTLEAERKRIKRERDENHENREPTVD